MPVFVGHPCRSQPEFSSFSAQEDCCSSSFSPHHPLTFHGVELVGPFPTSADHTAKLAVGHPDVLGSVGHYLAGKATVPIGPRHDLQILVRKHCYLRHSGE